MTFSTEVKELTMDDLRGQIKAGGNNSLSDSRARLLVEGVFKSKSIDSEDEDGEDADLHKSYLKTQLAAHIQKKSSRLKNAMARNKTKAMKGELINDDEFSQITNNLSLQISRHTSRHSRHSRYDDDSTTDEEDEDADSFCCGGDLEPTFEVDELMERSSGHAKEKNPIPRVVDLS